MDFVVQEAKNRPFVKEKCRKCGKTFKTKGSTLCKKCWEKSLEGCLICGEELWEDDVYCNKCNETREKLWEDFLAKTPKEKLDKMEEEGSLDYVFMGIDLAMVLGKK
jgi:transposase-like protein